jgi:hypothetical protein
MFFSTRVHAQLVGAAFVLAAAVSWLAAGYDLGELRIVAAIQHGASLAPADRVAHIRAGLLVGVTQLACAVLLAAAFLPWLHQARANLRALGARRLRFGREWTYLGFAIPLLNAFRPYQVVSEVWRASDPASGDPLEWQRLPASRLVIAWWVLLVAWVALEVLAGLLVGVAPGLGAIQLARALSLAADVSAAASASLGYFVVTRISAAQDAKWRAFGSGDAAIPALGRDGVAA